MQECRKLGAFDIQTRFDAFGIMPINSLCRDVRFCCLHVENCSNGFGILDRTRFSVQFPAMEEMARTILVVDDDPEIGRLVAALLSREGFDVRTAENGMELDDVLRKVRPDLIILDLMLPGEDGLSICRRMRSEGAFPILMLTAKNDEMDRVVGLEVGADDYVSKPFGPRELLARVRALLRRTQSQPFHAASRRYSFDRFVIDLDARQLTDEDGAPATLTSAEFDLLTCFVLRPRRVLSRDQILDWTHGRTADPLDRTVDILVSRLRKKLESLSPGNTLISTVRNGGYLLTVPVRQVS
ncbi:response regulator transcription factor [Rhizobium leguminosarum]|nr:response regulator transcription factor [Rhizobium leguminosarum]TBG69465.1 response regulator transcription factor [Rhizobium leguminosarum]TBH03336.1 response regulator transcription factor [Rhizobium leguminosarum]TBH12774.1 response regulator transcription factor [Rhizobium leguminosarum]TBH37826.1 response regulator transcription factor [Rhizobium leguminosarum]